MEKNGIGIAMAGELASRFEIIISVDAKVY
jgi:hypothetical protein